MRLPTLGTSEPNGVAPLVPAMCFFFSSFSLFPSTRYVRISLSSFVPANGRFAFDYAGRARPISQVYVERVRRRTRAEMDESCFFYGLATSAATISRERKLRDVFFKCAKFPRFSRASHPKRPKVYRTSSRPCYRRPYFTDLFSASSLFPDTRHTHFLFFSPY